MSESSCSAITVNADQRIARIQKERRARRQHGRIHAYIARDHVAHSHVLLAQKLSYLAEYVSNSIGDEPVSISALFKRIPDGRRTKCRWTIEAVDLESAPERLEAVRSDGYQHCVVLGTPECYELAAV